MKILVASFTFVSRIAPTILLTLMFGPVAVAQKEIPGVRQYQNLTETLGCKKTGGELSAIDFDFISALRIIYGGRDIPFYALPAEIYCIKNHRAHKMILWETKQVLGETDVELVGFTTLKTLYSDAKLVATKFPGMTDWLDSIKVHLKVYYPDVKETDPIVGFKFSQIRKSDNFLNPYSYVTPLKHRFATTVDQPTAAKIVAAEKPFIIDTRQKKFFDWWHLPNAKSFPSVFKGVMYGVPFDYSEMYRGQAFVPPSELPKDFNTKMLVMGYSVTDWSSYYIVTLLHILGYNDVYWYRGGQEDWHQIRRVLPDGLPPDGVERITAKELMADTKKFSLIDVRNHGLFMQGHIENSLSIPYDTTRMPPRIDGQYGPETLIYDRWYDNLLPRDKSKPLVIIGTDESDWNAVLATRKANQLGYKARWFRGGAAEWTALNKWYGEKYSIKTGH